MGLATSTLVDVATNGKDQHRLNAAKILLDRAPAPIDAPAPSPTDSHDILAEIKRKLEERETMREADNPDRTGQY